MRRLAAAGSRDIRMSHGNYVCLRAKTPLASSWHHLSNQAASIKGARIKQNSYLALKRHEMLERAPVFERLPQSNFAALPYVCL